MGERVKSRTGAKGVDNKIQKGGQSKKKKGTKRQVVWRGPGWRSLITIDRKFQSIEAVAVLVSMSSLPRHFHLALSFLYSSLAFFVRG